MALQKKHLPFYSLKCKWKSHLCVAVPAWEDNLSFTQNVSVRAKVDFNRKHIYLVEIEKYFLNVQVSSKSVYQN